MPRPKSFTLDVIVVEPGVGFECPYLRTVCKVCLNSLPDGTSEDDLERLCGCKVNTEIDYKLGCEEGNFSYVIDLICKKMKRKSCFNCKVTFSEKSIFLPCQTISFSIKLMSWSELSMQIYLLKPETCLDYALENKETGTKLFKQSRTNVASCFYSQAIKYLITANSCNDVSDEIKEKVNNVLITCHVNLAACLLKYELYPETISNCSDALLLQHDHLKALYRRAVSYLALNDLDNAEKDIMFGLELDKQNKAFANLHSDFRIKMAKVNKQLSDQLKKLF